MANDSYVYSIVDENTTTYDGSSGFPNRTGMGMMRFCVRSSIGTNGTNNQALSLADQIGGGYQEVNFIESIITIFYDMTAGFEVISFNVEPKERLETTVAKDTYKLIAYLCTPGDLVAQTDPVRQLPDPITAYDYDESNPTSGDAYNQGALIRVCVAPDGDAYRDGIRMDGLNSFTWAREEVLFPTNTPGVSQPAIVNEIAAPNGLTSYVPSQCVGGFEYCHFSSILFADFYINRGFVTGEGTADLIFANPGAAAKFPTGRRLGADESVVKSRKLQDGAEGEFDLSVAVNGPDDGPGALRTAGGASVGLSALASAVALLSAALLA